MRKLDNFVDFDPMFETIRRTEEITPNEKILLSKIITFYINEKKCTAGNGWFATNLVVKKNSISTMINNLLRKGFIECTYYYDSETQTKKRWIKITQKTINLITKNAQQEVAPTKEEPQPQQEPYKEEQPQEIYKPSSLNAEKIEEYVNKFDDDVKPYAREYLKGKGELFIPMIKMILNLPKDKQIEKLRK